MTYTIILFVIKVLNLYSNILTCWIIASLLIYFDVVNKRQAVVQKIMYFLDALISPALNQIRKVIPMVGGVDVSPIALYLLISLVVSILYGIMLPL